MENIMNKTEKQTKTIKAGVRMDEETIPFPVVASVKQLVNYRIFLYGETSSAFDFVEAINAIDNAEEHDSITIYLSGGGGCVSSTDAFLHAIETAQSRGVHVHCVASGLVASAHTFIILACSSYECAAGTHFLIHNGSLGDGGSYNQFKASSQFFLKYMETRFREVYHHFLSEEELDDVLEGKDLWLTAQQFSDRYQKRNELLQAEIEAEQNENGVANDNSIPPITTEQIKAAAKVGDEQFKEYCVTKDGFPIGKWIEWEGGEQPVGDNIAVQVIFADGLDDEGLAVDWEWSSGNGCADIVNFRIIPQDELEE